MRAKRNQAVEDGCHVHPRCLTCPLAVCVLDDPAYVRRMDQEARQERVRRMLREGRTISEVASAEGITERTVFRIRAGK